MLVGICRSALPLLPNGLKNPDALNIRIFNPKNALQMLILHAGGFQIHLSV